MTHLKIRQTVVYLHDKIILIINYPNKDSSYQEIVYKATDEELNNIDLSENVRIEEYFIS